MTKPIFIACFFYNPSTNHFLLLEKQEPSLKHPNYEVFGLETEDTQSKEEVLQQHLQDLTGAPISSEAFSFVYKYYYKEIDRFRYVYSVDVTDVLDHPYFTSEELRWLPLADLNKAKLTGRTKQDLVFFQRETNAAEQPS